MTEFTAADVHRVGVTGLYAVIVVVVLPSAWHWLLSPTIDIFGARFISGLSENLGWVYRDWFVWVWAGILVSGQAMLLFLSADTRWRRRRPHQHRAGTVLTVALLAALLTVAAFWSLEILVQWSLRAAGSPEDVVRSFLRPLLAISPMGGTPATYFMHLAWWLGLWMIWTTALCLVGRMSPIKLAAAVSSLFKGSALALLLAASAHVAVSRSDSLEWLFVDAFTAFYIVTAVGIMLLCLGQGVLALDMKRLDAHFRKSERHT